MIIPIIKGTYKAGKLALKLAKKTPAKVYKYGASSLGGAYVGSAIGKKKRKKKSFRNS